MPTLSLYPTTSCTTLTLVASDEFQLIPPLQPDLINLIDTVPCLSNYTDRLCYPSNNVLLLYVFNNSLSLFVFNRLSLLLSKLVAVMLQILDITGLRMRLGLG